MYYVEDKIKLWYDIYAKKPLKIKNIFVLYINFYRHLVQLVHRLETININMECKNTEQPKENILHSPPQKLI